MPPVGMTVTDWLSAVGSLIAGIGSIAAVVVATIAARATWKQVKHLEKQVESQQEQKDQEQASKFAAWITFDFENSDTPAVYLHCVNRSELPIYSLMVTLSALPDSKAIASVIEPFEGVKTRKIDFPSLWVKDESKRLFDLSRNADFQTPLGVSSHWTPIAFDLGSEIEKNGIMIQFRDLNNFIWRREPNGALHRVEESYSPEWKRIFQDDPATPAMKFADSEISIGFFEELHLHKNDDFPPG